MTENMDDISERSKKLKDFFPVTIFIILTFLLEVFGLSKATNLVISVFISLFSFGILSAMLREKFGDLDELKPLQKKIGILSVTYVFIIGIAVLHWYQILHVNIRWTLFFVVLILYFFLLFKAVNMLHLIKSNLINRKK